MLSRNTLHYGDNLDVLRVMPGESIDLIYLDPPFNSNRNYNVLFKDESGVESDAHLGHLQTGRKGADRGQVADGVQILIRMETK